MCAVKNKSNKIKNNLAVIIFFVMLFAAYNVFFSLINAYKSGYWNITELAIWAVVSIASLFGVAKLGGITVIWDWLCSLKVNVIILILLALTSIFGTVIPQGKEPAMYIRFAGAKWYEFFKATQLDDMYHSYWFVALLGLLCVTITCCSIDKFPVVWRFIAKPKKDLDDNQVKFSTLKETLTLKTTTGEAAKVYGTFLTKKVSIPEHTEIEGTHHLFAQTGLWTRFGVYITHLSLLIIIIGALIGVFWGKRGYVAIPEFTETSNFRLRSGDMAPLGFTLMCNGYETTYYENSNQPKEFASDITVIENGRGIFRQIVKVNHTLKYRGYTFYQSNFGAAGDNAFYALIDIVRKSDGATIAKNSILHNSNKTPMPGTNDMLELVSYKDDEQYGPMAGLKLHKEDGSTKSFWAYPRYQQLEDKREGDYKFLIQKVKALEYTGFQVTKDPGVWVVYFGCGLMILGTLIAFFMSHKRFWIRIEEDKVEENIKVIFAASTNKNKETFERQFAILKENFIKFEA
jgi:cytochrome c biogenesis protein